MVLICVVLFLGYRVYIVVNPQEPPLPPPPRPPGPVLPPEAGPGVPPLRPPASIPEPRQDFVFRNMFVYRPGTVTQAEDRAKHLKLLYILPSGEGSYRAQIKTKATTKWYSVGDPFESYQLDSIDPEAKCVDIWSTEDTDTLRICIGD